MYYKESDLEIKVSTLFTFNWGNNSFRTPVKNPWSNTEDEEDTDIKHSVKTFFNY